MGSPRRQLEQSQPNLAFAPRKTLRVLFDARKLGDGGIGTTIRTGLEAMAQLGEVAITAIVSSTQQSALPVGVTSIVDATRDLTFDHLFRFSKRLPLSDYDIFHIPHYFIPIGVNIPLVVTVHDTTHISHPERFFYPVVARQMIGYAARKATRVITVSQASRNSLLQLGVPDQKIRVIANARSFPIRPFQGQGQELKANNGRSDCNLLAVFSNLKPHKGLSDLLTAFAAAQQHHKGLKLTLAGFGFSDRSDRLVEQALQMPGVTVLSEVSQTQLSNLYASCDAVVIPSLAEGFGLMLTEAHSHGKGVIVRPVPALTENIAPTDLCASDFSVAALCQVLESAALNPPPAPSHIFMSGEQARLDPGLLARATLDVYREACA